MDQDRPQLPPPEDRLKSRKPIPPPRPAYLPTAGSPLTVDRDLYSSIQSAPRTLVESFVLPIRSGKAWKALAKSIVRISTPGGPQVGMQTSRPPNSLVTLLPRHRLVVMLTDCCRRPQYLVAPQTPRTLLGRPHQTAAPIPPVHARPSLVLLTIYASPMHHHRRLPVLVRQGRDGRAMS